MITYHLSSHTCIYKLSPEPKRPRLCPQRQHTVHTKGINCSHPSFHLACTTARIGNKAIQLRPDLKQQHSSTYIFRCINKANQLALEITLSAIYHLLYYLHCIILLLYSVKIYVFIILNIHRRKLFSAAQKAESSQDVDGHPLSWSTQSILGRLHHTIRFWQGITVQPWLTWNSPYRLGWSWTLKDLPVSASCTTPDLEFPLIKKKRKETKPGHM